MEKGDIRFFLEAIICVKGRSVFFFFSMKVTMTPEIKCILQHSEGLCEFSSKLFMSNNAMITKEQKGTQNI